MNPSLLILDRLIILFANCSHYYTVEFQITLPDSLTCNWRLKEILSSCCWNTGRTQLQILECCHETQEGLKSKSHNVVMKHRKDSNHSLTMLSWKTGRDSNQSHTMLSWNTRRTQIKVPQCCHETQEGLESKSHNVVMKHRKGSNQSLTMLLWNAGRAQIKALQCCHKIQEGLRSKPHNVVTKQRKDSHQSLHNVVIKHRKDSNQNRTMLSSNTERVQVKAAPCCHETQEGLKSKPHCVVMKHRKGFKSKPHHVVMKHRKDLNQSLTPCCHETTGRTQIKAITILSQKHRKDSN